MFDFINRIKAHAHALDTQMMAELEVNGDRLASRLSVTRFTTLIVLGIGIVAVFTIPNPSPKIHRIQSTTIQK